MAFEITDSALSFIKDKGFNEITVNVANVGGGCTGSFKEVEVRLGRPKDLSRFKKTEVSGISIYHPDSKFINEGKFSLVLEKVLFFKRLALKKKD